MDVTSKWRLRIMKASRLIMTAAALVGAQPLAAQSFGSGRAQAQEQGGDWLSQLGQMQRANPDGYRVPQQMQPRSGPLNSIRTQNTLDQNGRIDEQCITNMHALVTPIGQRAENGDDLVLVIPAAAVQQRSVGNVDSAYAYRSAVFVARFDENRYEMAYDAYRRGYADKWFIEASRNYQVPFITHRQYGSLMMQESYRQPADPRTINDTLQQSAIARYCLGGR